MSLFKNVLSNIKKFSMVGNIITIVQVVIQVIEEGETLLSNFGDVKTPDYSYVAKKSYPKVEKFFPNCTELEVKDSLTKITDAVYSIRALFIKNNSK